MVGWDAVMPEHGGLQTWNGHGRLNPGDIVLLHFLPGLDGQIARLLAAIRAPGPKRLGSKVSKPGFGFVIEEDCDWVIVES